MTKYKNTLSNEQCSGVEKHILTEYWITWENGKHLYTTMYWNPKVSYKIVVGFFFLWWGCSDLFVYQKIQNFKYVYFNYNGLCVHVCVHGWMSLKIVI